MSRQGMKAALEHGRQLPEFLDVKTAKIELFRLRDQLIHKLTNAAQFSDTFSADFSPDSLKEIEKWYFELWESKSFGEIGIERELFERCISMYYGEVIVRNAPEFEWFVEEFVFMPGRYEIGVRKDMASLALRREIDLYARTDNKRQQSIWREFCRWTK